MRRSVYIETTIISYLKAWPSRDLVRDRIEEACEQAGLRPPKICTPEELMGDEP